MLIIKRFLMFIYVIMHLPKFILCCSCLCCLCCVLSVRMNLSYWKIAKYKAQFITKFILNLLDYWIRLSAIWTFIVSIFNQSYRCCFLSLNMIAIVADRESQFYSVCFHKPTLPSYSFYLCSFVDLEIDSK